MRRLATRAVTAWALALTTLLGCGCFPGVNLARGRFGARGYASMTATERAAEVDKLLAAARLSEPVEIRSPVLGIPFIEFGGNDAPSVLEAMWPYAVPRLIEVLATGEEAAIWNLAAAHFPAPRDAEDPLAYEAAAALRRLYRAAAGRSQRRRLAEVVMRVAPPGPGLEFLDEVLDLDPDREVRAAALGGWLNRSRPGDETAAGRVLGHVLRTDPSPRVRALAARRMGLGRGVGRAGPGNGSKALLRTVALDTSPEVRLRAVRSLEWDPAAPRAEPGETAGTLAKLFPKESDDRVRAAMISYLAATTRIGPDLVARALRDSSPAVRTEALFALAAARSPEARRRASEALSDPDPGVRAGAALVFLAVPVTPSAARDLVETLGDPDPGVRRNAFWALERLARDRFGYDPRLAPADQADALAAWRKWAEETYADPGPGGPDRNL
jgi:hypothetical protein